MTTIDATLEVRRTIEAPIAEGDALGEVTLELHGEVIFSAPLVALTDVPEAGLLGQARDFVQLFFTRLFSGGE